MKEYLTDSDRRRAESMKKRWSSLTEEERLVISIRQSIAAKRMWMKRGVAERKRIGQLISIAKKGVDDGSV